MYSCYRRYGPERLYEESLSFVCINVHESSIEALSRFPFQAMLDIRDCRDIYILLFGGSVLPSLIRLPSLIVASSGVFMLHSTYTNLPLLIFLERYRKTRRDEHLPVFIIVCNAHSRTDPILRHAVMRVN